MKHEGSDNDMEITCPSRPLVDLGSTSLTELCPELLGLTASFLPSEKVVTGLLSTSKSLYKNKQVRCAVTALNFKFPIMVCPGSLSSRRMVALVAKIPRLATAKPSFLHAAVTMFYLAARFPRPVSANLKSSKTDGHGGESAR